MVLPLTKSKQINIFKRDIIQEELSKVCYFYKLTEPKIYLTKEGRENFYYFHFRESQKYIVLNENFISLLDREAIKTILILLLNPELKNYYRTASLFSAFTVYAIFPWYSILKIGKKFFGKSHEYFLSGFYGFYKVIVFSLTELVHSIYLNPQKILKADKVVKNLGLEMKFLELVERIRNQKNHLTIDEKIFLTNAFMQIPDDYLIYSVMADYVDLDKRLENLEAKI